MKIVIMKRILNNSKKEKLEFLKKQDNVSLYGPYVEMCYNAMTHLKEHKGYEISDERLYERNYMISLSYMMGKYDGKEEKMSGLIVGGDSNKYVFGEYIRNAINEVKKIMKTKEILRFSADYIAPDFIIHKNNRIKDINERNQKIIIEAKTKNKLLPKDFFDDFFKLNVYLSRLKFRYSIYLILNTSVSSIDDLIKRYIRADYYTCEKCKNRMLFLVQEKESDVPALYVFKKEPVIY